ncbi:MAG TPA: NUDIX domain-containing protein [Nitrososphaeraceae archaeon]|nr:NUDIX domain-containing protein [Nitrososphaeraceae archaeon]
MAPEQSVGAVIKYWLPSRDSGRNSEFLLLRNRRGFWGFPQGHKEKGETELQTLVREVTEETGIKSLDIQSYIGKISYSFFRGDGIKSEKEVIFYFATTSTRNVRISYEHAGYKWASYLDALLMLGHRQLKSILSRGHQKGLY